ncbi:TetR/AcrR family transcriptional regulator [Alteromonas lipolytica]|uniref:HTH tetR-type domain-containing protein n=1 Tax=Alteromonas lipolytica TaxID=1856405 RepID=A0A1E8FFG9_9ALTE|nr:TetR/AcrR family transcriptional regulator [Alteromonas lipolytica]OFI34674.1 hypothetical protein BFC17_13890 [Alteromonas lipolytica]GGF53082.1 TetR family transcriptional regulator [Alteromonas lipolytica]
MSNSREQSIQQAMTVFWQKGYVGAGMRDIQTALDKRPGSIYAAFGNKEGLYLAALEVYTQGIADRLIACSHAAEPLDALKEFLGTPLLQNDEDTYMRQCLIVKTQADWLELPEGIQNSLRKALGNVRDGLIAVIEAAKAKQALAESLPTEQAATWLQGQFIALRTMATTVDDASSLSWMLDKMFSDLKKQW